MTEPRKPRCIMGTADASLNPVASHADETTQTADRDDEKEERHEQRQTKRRGTEPIPEATIQEWVKSYAPTSSDDDTELERRATDLLSRIQAHGVMMANQDHEPSPYKEWTRELRGRDAELEDRRRVLMEKEMATADMLRCCRDVVGEIVGVQIWAMYEQIQQEREAAATAVFDADVRQEALERQYRRQQEAAELAASLVIHNALVRSSTDPFVQGIRDGIHARMVEAERCAAVDDAKEIFLLEQRMKALLQPRHRPPSVPTRHVH